jgi:hypothetical protein
VWGYLANKLEAQFDRGQLESVAHMVVCRDLGISLERLALLPRFAAEREKREQQAPTRAPPPQPEPRWESPRYEIDRDRGRGRGREL